MKLYSIKINAEGDTQKQIKLIRKVAGCKVNLQKLVAFLYTHNKLTEWEMEKTTSIDNDINKIT